MITWTLAAMLVNVFMTIRAAEGAYKRYVETEGPSTIPYVVVSFFMLLFTVPLIWFFGWVALPSYGWSALPACGGILR